MSTQEPTVSTGREEVECWQGDAAFQAQLDLASDSEEEDERRDDEDATRVTNNSVSDDVVFVLEDDECQVEGIGEAEETPLNEEEIDDPEPPGPVPCPRSARRGRRNIL